MDLGFFLSFERPWFFGLLVLLPLIWVLSFNSLSGLGRWRRWLALGLRSLVVLLLIGALANTQFQRKTDKLTVIYLLDQSESIPLDQRERMLDFVHREVRQNRRKEAQDMAGVIVFGADAKLESAPFDGELPLAERLESIQDLRTSATSIESALKLAKASFPEDSARRVVIVTDGNQNLGDAVSVAQSMADDGIGIDVLAVELNATSEVSIEKVVLPSDVRKGQEFETRIVLNNDSSDPAGQAARAVAGKLKVTRRTPQSEELVFEQEIELDPGKNIRGFTSKLDHSAAYTYEAEFIPNDAKEDTVDQNNRASAFTHVRGKGKVLLIEDGFNQGEFLELIRNLQANSVEVDVMNTSELYTSTAQLLQYDSIILANLPRAAGEDGHSDVQSFTDAQIKMLVDNCEHMGCGIVMIGGDRSFGAGGWANTPLEAAMPVDFQIKNDKISAVGALAMLMHACELPEGNHWEVKIAGEALNVLGPMDYCGVVEWKFQNGNGNWLWKLPNGVDRVFENKQTMLGMIGRMQPGDMPDFEGPMKLMLSGLRKCNASMKHAIIISDGDPSPPTTGILQAFKANKIKISTVAIGTHGPPGSTPLKRIADATGGSYYVVKSAKALPKIYQREARRVAKPVVKESSSGMSSRLVAGAGAHQILRGVDHAQLPAFFGFVMTTIKKSNLVEQLLLSSEPAKDNGENSTLLATWRYGNGRTVVFTSDAGHKWNPKHEANDKLFVQMVRYSMRPITESANFSIATEAKDGKARIVVTALNDQEEFLNFLNVNGRGISTDGKDVELTFTQVGPGRYVAEHDIEGAGNLLYSIFPGEGYERLTAGINVPYSTEYSDRESNRALMETLVSLQPKGGEAGKILEGDMTKLGLDRLLANNTFRPTLTAAVGIQDIWPLLLLFCSFVFFADVFVRRVAVSFNWVGDGYRSLVARIQGKEQVQPQESLDRLRSRKAEVEREIEARRATSRFEPESGNTISGKEQLEQVLSSEIEKTPALPPRLAKDKLEAERENNFTSRLLDVKRKAQQNRPRHEQPPES
jgi:uncharacterized membrane protein